MGGDTQPQVVLQLLARLLVARRVPGAVHRRAPLAPGRPAASTRGPAAGPATSASRPTRRRAGSPGFAARGHEVRVEPAWNSGYGHAHLIERTEDGVLAGAHDPRALTGATATW